MNRYFMSVAGFTRAVNKTGIYQILKLQTLLQIYLDRVCQILCKDMTHPHRYSDQTFSQGCWVCEHPQQCPNTPVSFVASVWVGQPYDSCDLTGIFSQCESDQSSAQVESGAGFLRIYEVTKFHECLRCTFPCPNRQQKGQLCLQNTPIHL